MTVKWLGSNTSRICLCLPIDSILKKYISPLTHSLLYLLVSFVSNKKHNQIFYQIHQSLFNLNYIDQSVLLILNRVIFQLEIMLCIHLQIGHITKSYTSGVAIPSQYYLMKYIQSYLQDYLQHYRIISVCKYSL